MSIGVPQQSGSSLKNGLQANLAADCSTPRHHVDRSAVAVRKQLEKRLASKPGGGLLHPASPLCADQRRDAPDMIEERQKGRPLGQPFDL